MRLTDLEPEFLTITSGQSFRCHNDFATAQGIIFLCPICFTKNNGPVGTEHIICWFANCNVPATMYPLPGRWNPSGTGYHDLTFVGPGAASVLIQGGCNAHFFITNGEIRF